MKGCLKTATRKDRECDERSQQKCMGHFDIGTLQRLRRIHAEELDRQGWRSVSMVFIPFS